MAAGNPSNVSAINQTDTTVLVYWTNAQTTHDNNEVEYRSYSGSWGSWTSASAVVAADATSYTVTGLTAGTRYEFRVTALDAVEGDSSAVSSNQLFTLPTSAGLYWGYRTLTDSSYNTIIKVEGDSPYFTIRAQNLTGETAYSQSNIRPDQFTAANSNNRVYFGPGVTTATFEV